MENDADTMVERVARVLHDVSFSDRGWHDVPEAGTVGKEGYRQRARIVIKAMRTPSIEMVANCGDLPGSQRDYWHRSIDAALSQG